MVIEGDFVPGVVASSNPLKPVDGYNVFPFPSIDGSPPTSVVGGGDTLDDVQGHARGPRRSSSYLATPRRPTIWAKRGGFSSPNKNVAASVYPDAITRTTATALAKAQDVPLRHVRPAAGRVRRHGRARASSRSSRTS